MFIRSTDPTREPITRAVRGDVQYCPHGKFVNGWTLWNTPAFPEAGIDCVMFGEQMPSWYLSPVGVLIYIPWNPMEILSALPRCLSGKRTDECIQLVASNPVFFADEGFEQLEANKDLWAGGTRGGDDDDDEPPEGPDSVDY